MVHVPGKQMYTRDTLSRLQRKQPDSKPEESLIPDKEMSAFVCSIVDALPVSDIKLKQIIEAQEEDEVCKQIRQINTEFQAVLSHIGVREEKLQSTKE